MTSAYRQIIVTMINHSFQSSLSLSYESSSVSCLFQHIFNKLLLHCLCFQFLAVYLHIFSTYVFPLVSSSLVSLSFFPPILLSSYSPSPLHLIAFYIFCCYSTSS